MTINAVWRLFLPVLFLGLFSSFPGAEEMVRTDQVTARLISSHASIAPGKPFWAAVVLKPKTDWHVYWQNPGDSGMPTTISWELPEQLSVDRAMRWPVPTRFEEEAGVTYGYSDDVVFAIRLQPNASLEAGDAVRLRVDVSWLACREACIPGDAALDLRLPVAARPVPAKENLATIEEAVRKLPETRDWDFSLDVEKSSLILSFRSPAWVREPKTELQFFAAREGVVETSAPQIVEREGKHLRLRLTRSRFSEAPPRALKGVLVIRTKTGRHLGIELNVKKD